MFQEFWGKMNFIWHFHQFIKDNFLPNSCLLVFLEVTSLLTNISVDLLIGFIELSDIEDVNKNIQNTIQEINVISFEINQFKFYEA